MPDPSIEPAKAQSLTVVIPTYRREAVLIDTLSQLSALSPAPAEIIVVDQTEQHEAATDAELRQLELQGTIRWLRREQPSIPAAMNAGLIAARSEVVLFLDDDIRPDADLVAAHLHVQQSKPGLVAGQVLQPGQVSEDLKPNEPFRFNSTKPAEIQEFMGGNFSIQRQTALALGGFDENFVGAAYRFEAELAHRYTQRHGLIHYAPNALIHHLQAPAGGTRAHGHHLRTVKPGHSVGAYYYLLRTRKPLWWQDALLRPLRSVRTRHHLRRPWWIPLTLVAELRGWLAAVRLLRQGPRLIGPRQ